MTQQPDPKELDALYKALEKEGFVFTQKHLAPDRQLQYGLLYSHPVTEEYYWVNRHTFTELKQRFIPEPYAKGDSLA